MTCQTKTQHIIVIEPCRFSVGGVPMIMKLGHLLLIGESRLSRSFFTLCLLLSQQAKHNLILARSDPEVETILTIYFQEFETRVAVANTTVLL